MGGGGIRRGRRESDLERCDWSRDFEKILAMALWICGDPAGYFSLLCFFVNFAFKFFVFADAVVRKVKNLISFSFRVILLNGRVGWIFIDK